MGVRWHVLYPYERDLVPVTTLLGLACTAVVIVASIWCHKILQLQRTPGKVVLLNGQLGVEWEGTGGSTYRCLHPWPECKGLLLNTSTNVWHEAEQPWYVSEEPPVPHLGIAGILLFAPVLVALLLAQRKP